MSKIHRSQSLAGLLSRALKTTTLVDSLMSSHGGEEPGQYCLTQSPQPSWRECHPGPPTSRDQLLALAQPWDPEQVALTSGSQFADLQKWEGLACKTVSRTTPQEEPLVWGTKVKQLCHSHIPRDCRLIPATDNPEVTFGGFAGLVEFGFCL